MRRLLTLIAISFSVLFIAACAGSSTQPQTEPTVLPPQANNGTVADYLNGFDAQHLNGIELPRGVAIDRNRVTNDTEKRYVAATREDPNSAEASPSFDALDDDALLYLGYLYCAARDARLPIDRAVASVVDVVARTGGRDPTSPSTNDFIVSVTIVNLASGSLCPELYTDTRAFLDDLTSDS